MRSVDVSASCVCCSAQRKQNASYCKVLFFGDIVVLVPRSKTRACQCLKLQFGGVFTRVNFEASIRACRCLNSTRSPAHCPLSQSFLEWCARYCLTTRFSSTTTPPGRAQISEALRVPGSSQVAGIPYPTQPSHRHSHHSHNSSTHPRIHLTHRGELQCWCGYTMGTRCSVSRTPDADRHSHSLALTHVAGYVPGSCHDSF